MKNTELNTAHAMLDLILTKAALNGKIGRMTLRLPHRLLVPESEKYDDVDIIVNISTKWEQSKNGETEITSEFTKS